MLKNHLENNNLITYIGHTRCYSSSGDKRLYVCGNGSFLFYNESTDRAIVFDLQNCNCFAERYCCCLLHIFYYYFIFLVVRLKYLFIVCRQFILKTRKQMVLLSHLGWIEPIVFEDF